MSTTRSFPLAPGVAFREIDYSQYVKDLTANIPGMVGPKQKGKKNQRYLNTSLEQLIHNIGIPRSSHPALIAAREFFNAGGGRLIYVPVANGDVAATTTVDLVDTTTVSVSAKDTGTYFEGQQLKFSYGEQKKTKVSEAHTFPALTRTTTLTIGGTKTTNDVITLTVTDAALVGTPLAIAYTVQAGDDLAAIAAGLNALIDGNAALGTAKINSTVSGQVITIVSNSPNATSYAVTYSGGATVTGTLSGPTNVLSHTYSPDPLVTNKPLVAGTIVVKFGSTQVATDSVTAGVLTFISGYSQYSGTVDYITGEIVITTTNLTTANVVSAVEVSGYHWSNFKATISISIKNDDGEVVSGPHIMETIQGITLENMVEKFADSEHVDIPTAFDSFPVSGTYTFTGADDGIDNLVDGDYIGDLIEGTATGMQLLANANAVDINLLVVPEASKSLAVRQAMIQLVEVQRRDTLAIIDSPAGISVSSVADWANGEQAYASYDSVQSTYAALYYPHYKTYNPTTRQNEVTPPCAAALAAFARTQSWEAPAGPSRGKLLNITDIDVELNDNDRAFLADNRVNCIADLNGLGTMVLSQQTATTQATSLDRIGPRMMLMRIEKAITTLMYAFLFEGNSPRTWNKVSMIVDPYLQQLEKAEKIYAGKFVCNRNTNSDQNIKNKIMSAVCTLQLLQHAEIILVTFLISQIGQTISEQEISAAAQI